MNNAERKVALFDLDGTLVSAHLWLGIVKRSFNVKENRLVVFWYIISHLALTLPWKMHLISTEKYYRSWGEDVAKTIKGIKTEKAKEIFNWLANNYLLPSLKKNTFEKLKEHQKDGFLTILTSGTFQELLEIIANRLKIDFAIGTKLEVVKDKFSGRIIPPFCFGEGKAEKLRDFLSEKKLKINFKESFAYSDGIFDLPMLELVGNPVAVEPDKKLLEIAKNKGWQII
jgi:HAD superfamily hydrolase (TIGR01490 family)